MVGWLGSGRVGGVAGVLPNGLLGGAVFCSFVERCPCPGVSPTARDPLARLGCGEWLGGAWYALGVAGRRGPGDDGVSDQLGGCSDAAADEGVDSARRAAAAAG